MIKKLTRRQENLIPKHRDEWLNHFFSCPKINRKKASKYINWIYEFCGYKKPIIIFLDSPLAMQIGTNASVKALSNLDWKDKKSYLQIRSQIDLQIYSQIDSQIYSQIDSQIYSQIDSQIRSQIYLQIYSQIYSQIYLQIRSQIDSQIYSQIYLQIRSQIDSQIYSQIDSQIRSQIYLQIYSQIYSQIGSQKLEYYYSGYEGTVFYISWYAYLDFYRRSKLLPEELFEKHNNLIAFSKANCYDMIYLDGFCVVSEMPLYIERDDFFRLHSQQKSAIKWKDGYELYYLFGVHFEKDLWEKIVGNKISVKEILNLQNMEQRMAALKVKGAANLLIEANATLLDKSAKGNELYLIENVYSQPAYFLKYQDPSTSREYVSGIDPKVGKNKNADECMAWKFNLPVTEYLSIIKES